MNPSRKLTVAHYRCSECELRFFKIGDRNQHENEVHRPKHSDIELTEHLQIELVEDPKHGGRKVVMVSQR